MYGFWMNKKGKYFPTNEHGTDVIRNSKKFGVDKLEIEKLLKKAPYNSQSTDEKSSRGEILKLAFKNGWIRIRGSSGQFSFQFWGNKKRIAELILEDFGEEYFGLFTSIILHDLKSKTKWTGTYQELKQGLEDIQDSEASSDTEKSIGSPYNIDSLSRGKIRDRITPPHATFGEAIKKKLKKLLL
jgi:hypothetical protein